MKSTRFLLATLALAGAPLLAAPVAPPLAPAAAPAPQINTKAVALFDQSIKAYAALDTLSQKFEIADYADGVVDAGASGQGTLQIQRPGKARLELDFDGEKTIHVADGTNFYSQADPTSYQKRAMSGASSLPVVAGMIPSAASLPLGALLTGQNPLSPDGGIKWEKVTLVSRDGLEGVSMQLPTQAGRNPVVFQVYFNPKTYLARAPRRAHPSSKKRTKSRSPIPTSPPLRPIIARLHPRLFSMCRPPAPS